MGLLTDCKSRCYSRNGFALVKVNFSFRGFPENLGFIHRVLQNICLCACICMRAVFVGSFCGVCLSSDG